MSVIAALSFVLVAGFVATGRAPVSVSIEF
jgi:hypothetical protein